MLIFDVSAFSSGKGKIATVKNRVIFDASGKRSGSYKGNEIYNGAGLKIGSLRNGTLFDDSGNKIAGLHQIKQELNSDVETMLAAVWLLAVHYKPAKSFKLLFQNP